jgi:putative redox protein
VCFNNLRGEKLAGGFHRPHGLPAASIIITHGFRGSKEGGGRAILLGEELARRGYAVLRFDFAGVGESEGEFSEITIERQVEDLLAAVQWVVDYGTGPKVPIVGLGRSFGGSTLIAAAAQDIKLDGVCLWATPFDLPGTFARILEEFFHRLKAGCPKVYLKDDKGNFALNATFVEDLYKYKLDPLLRQLSPRPILIIHGENDEVVGISQAWKAFQMALEPKVIQVIPQGDHQFTSTWELAWQALFAWLNQHFPGSSPKS